MQLGWAYLSCHAAVTLSVAIAFPSARRFNRKVRREIAHV
jgi:hypothetical protein